MWDLLIWTLQNITVSSYADFCPTIILLCLKGRRQKAEQEFFWAWRRSSVIYLWTCSKQEMLLRHSPCSRYKGNRDLSWVHSILHESLQLSWPKSTNLCYQHAQLFRWGRLWMMKAAKVGCKRIDGGEKSVLWVKWLLVVVEYCMSGIKSENQRPGKWLL